MLTGDNVKVKAVNGIKEIKNIKAFLQGSVYCWCKNRKEEWFTASNLLGGDNFDWGGTPLQILFDRQIKTENPNDEEIKQAIEQAGKEVGHILKSVLVEDKRHFKTEAGYTRRYLWID